MTNAFDGFLRDLRLALRGLTRAPGLATAVVLTLALGIGAGTAVFSLVEAVLLRPLPFPEGDRIVRLFSVLHGDPWSTSSPNFVDWRRDARSFSAMAAFDRASFALRLRDGAVRVRGARVTAGFFPVLGIEPRLGRGFAPGDERAGERLAVLGDRIWRARFGADPSIAGRAVRLDGEVYTVLGVAPPGLDFPREAQIWTLLTFTPEELATQRGAQWLDVVARLAPGTSRQRAATEIGGIARRLARQYPQSNRGLASSLVPLQESIVGEVRPALLLLFAAVALVLLIACANVANLLLARALGREREVAIRAALGAGRGRVMREVAAESLVLGLAGGAAGVLFAVWGTDLLTRLGPADVPRLGEARVDAGALVFALALSLAAGLLASLAPALQAAAATDLAGRLKDGGRGLGGNRRGGRARGALVIAEIALCATLLGGAGLLVRSFLALQRVNPGFASQGVLTFNLALPEAAYGKPERIAGFYRQVLARLEALPGVASAGAVFGLPLTAFSYSISLKELDGAPFADPSLAPSVEVRLLTPGYLRTLGIPVAEGRGLTAADRAGAPQVALVNRAAARLLWPGESPLGHRFMLGTRFGEERAGGEVVGVLPDLREASLAEAAQPTVYLPLEQNPSVFMTVAVRARRDPAALTPAVRAAITALDPEVPIYSVRTMEDLLAAAVARPRFTTFLLAAFAAAALALAALGVYGVLAYAVGRRTREIGIRMALGARPGAVLGMVAAGAARLTLTGLAAGLAGACAAGRLLAGQLYAVPPIDLPTLAAVALVLAAAAFAATWLPARRAVTVDPTTALRSE